MAAGIDASLGGVLGNSVDAQDYAAMGKPGSGAGSVGALGGDPTGLGGAGDPLLAIDQGAEDPELMNKF